MQNNLSESFCVIPWLGMSTKPSGAARVCCLMSNSKSKTKGILQKENGDYYNLGTDSFDEIKNAAKAKEVRLALLNGNQIEECNTCWVKEKHGSYSRRLNANYEYKDILTEESARQLTKDDGSIDLEPVYWDLRFGNLCNLKCLMCHPASSSQWYEDYALLYNTNKFGDSGKNVKLTINENGRYVDGGEYDWWKNPTFWENLQKKIPYIKQVYLVGGEPTLIEPHYTFLETIVESGRASEIIIEYDTNLTSLHSRAYDLWKHFKKIILRVSLEDFGEQNDYIRYPSKWRMIHNNLTTIKSWETNNIEIAMSCTWQILNSFTFLNLVDYLEYPVHVRMLSSPDYYDVAILPNEIKQELIEKYVQWGEVNPSKKKIIAHLIKYLNSTMDKVNNEKVKEFIRITEKLDELRNTDWKSTFTELHENLKPYI